MAESKNPVGRPTKMTKETLSRMEDAFKFGASDEEACAYVEISMTTFYEYQKKHPEFKDKKEQWKNNPILRAKKSLCEGLDNADLALKYLERKRSDEFSTKQEQKVEGDLKVSYSWDEESSNTLSSDAPSEETTQQQQ